MPSIRLAGHYNEGDGRRRALKTLLYLTGEK